MTRRRAGFGIWSRRVALLLIASAIALTARAQAPRGENPASAVPTELDLQAYRNELEHISKAIKNPAEIAELRKSLPDAWTVRDGDRVYPVSTKEISQALREIERDPKKPLATQLEARLRLMEQQANILSHSAHAVDRTPAEAKLKTVLSRGEFQDASGPSAWNLIRARINRWIFEHLLRLFRFMHTNQKTGNAIAWGVLFVAVVLLFYVLFQWLTRPGKNSAFRAEIEPLASDARHWVQEALAAADRSDFREAIHCAYWAAVARLEDVRVLPRDRARTPRESLRLLDQYPSEQGLLQTITRSFELIWYGYRPVSAADWAGAKEQLEKMGCLQGSIEPTVPS